METPPSPLTALILHHLRRRSVLRGLGIAAAGLALRSKPAHAAVAELIPLKPNPEGRITELYGLAGYRPGQGGAIGGAVAKRLAGLAPPAAKRLKLFHFNDMHNYLVHGGAPHGETHAMSQIVAKVRTAKAKAGPDDALLFVSVGDDRAGTGLDKLLGDITGTGFRTDPAYVAYSAAGVDVGALGNHEFDHGARTLRTGIRGSAKFPLLSANIHDSRELEAGRDYFPAAIGIVGGLRVAFLGLTTPVMKYFRKAGDPALKVASPVAVAKELLPNLAQLADVVLILSHCGYGEDFGPARKSDGWRFYIQEGDVSIAKAVAGLVDTPVVIVGGHTHTTLNAHRFDPDNLVGGVPILQAGAHGKYVGEATLTLEGGADTRFSARLHATRPRDDTVADPGAARTERDADFDAEFERRVIDPLQAQLHG